MSDERPEQPGDDRPEPQRDEPEFENPPYGDTSLEPEQEDSQPPGERVPEARLPVRLDQVDLDEVKRLLEVPGYLASAAVPGVDRFDHHRLTGNAAEEILSGRAAAGIKRGDLVQSSRVGSGRFQERFDADWRLYSGMVNRGLLAQLERSVLYEELGSQKVPVRLKHHGVGTDKHPGFPNSLFMLTLALGVSDRHCPSVAIPLTTNTRWDPSSPRFGERLPTWANENVIAGLPATLAGHVETVLAGETRLRRAALEAFHRTPDGHGISVQRLINTLPRYLVMPVIASGAPTAPYRECLEYLYPGRDPDVVATVARHGRLGLLQGGAPTEDEREAWGRDFVPLQQGPLPLAHGLGITIRFGVQFRFSAARQMLARTVVGEGGYTEVWQLVGFDADAEDSAIRTAAALIERQRIPWPRECLERWARDCGPGLLQAHAPTVCAGLLDVINAANMAIVDADRRTQAGLG